MVCLAFGFISTNAKRRNRVKKNDLISIVIPVYKVEQYLDRCVESIVNQTYKNLEIILVDDGSPDNCPKMCDEWAKKDKRIKVIHKKNGGVSSARNAGIELASGEYLQFVDSDDYIDVSFSESLLSGYESNDVDLICGGYKLVTLGNKTQIFTPKKYVGCSIFENSDKFLGFVMDGLNDVLHNKLFKTSIAKKIKFDTSLPLGEDRKFNLDYLRLIENKVGFVDNCGYNYVYNTSSAIHKKRDNAFDLLYTGLNNLFDFVKSKFIDYKCDDYYHFVGGFVVAVLCTTPKQLIKTNITRIKKLECIREYLQEFKPKSRKEKIRKWLIKHNCYKLLMGLSKIKTKLS